MPTLRNRDTLNPDGTVQVAPPTRSAFDPAPTAPKAGPVQKAAPPPTATGTGGSQPAGSDNPTADLSALNAAKNITQRPGKINQAVDDAS